MIVAEIVFAGGRVSVLAKAASTAGRPCAGGVARGSGIGAVARHLGPVGNLLGWRERRRQLSEAASSA